MKLHNTGFVSQTFLFFLNGDTLIEKGLKQQEEMSIFIMGFQWDNNYLQKFDDLSAGKTIHYFKYILVR